MTGGPEAVASDRNPALDLVDLHTHVLPGVDDGAASLDETIEVLRAAHDSGVRRLVATPHMFLEPWNHRDPTAIRAAHAGMLAALGERATHDASCSFVGELRIDLGAENYASPELLGAIESGRVLTMNGSRYLLLEFPTQLPGATIRSIVRRIRGLGRVPLVAHVERYAAFWERPRDLEALRDEGALLQVNAQSLVDDRSPERRRICVDWLRRKVVAVVASDVHGPTSRRPHLGVALRRLQDELAEDLLRACFSDNPRRVLDNLEVATASTR